MSDVPTHQSPNRLIHESSPYLLQHAYNPVDWYPWGEEPFAKARIEKKPVLLSIGYSACHWCHVMEKESFEDEAIAEMMNNHFVSIKVDREERPDLDHIYQSAVGLFIRRGGGWPLTMFLTPDQIPFYGGTYFPPNDRYGMPGFPTILKEVAEVYQERQEDVLKTVLDVQNRIKELSEGHFVSAGRKVNPDILRLAVKGLEMHFDSTHGGFGGAPKFPSTPALDLFLRYAHQTGDATALNRVTYTLGKMAWGGIYDQMGGGFHRYSTDARWLVPHFEKMLYDNAQLARLYFSTYQATGQIFYAQIGEEILDYVLREMTDPIGGFYSTQDADSEGEEGLFYVFRDEEIKSLLGKKEGAFFCHYYGVTPNGNFEGKNILWIPRPLDAVCKEMGLSLNEGQEIIRSGKPILLAEREKRIKPFRDEKILTNLNGLMISALVKGYQVTRKKRYLVAAQNAAHFVMEHLYKEGRLLRTYKDGISKLNGYLDDYTYFMNALLDIYEATMTSRYLDQARLLSAYLIDQFWDEERGGFFFTSRHHEKLVARHKNYTDQSVPSGNATAALALLRLFHLTHDQTYFEQGEKTLHCFSEVMEDNSYATGNFIAVADFYLRSPKEITILGDIESAEVERLLAHIHQLYLPNKIIRVEPQARPSGATTPMGDAPVVTICQLGACSMPLTDWEKIQSILLG